MMKRLSLILLVLACVACKKNQKSACGTQVCTAMFASFGIGFFDKDNNPITPANFEEVNLRTNKVMTHTYPPNIDYVAGYHILADDSDLKDLTTDGDMISVKGTNPATGQVKTVLFKISGGCNCHVAKVSGPDKIVFD